MFAGTVGEGNASLMISRRDFLVATSSSTPAYSMAFNICVG